MINDAPDPQPNDGERAAGRESLPTPREPAPGTLGWFPRELRYALRTLRRRPGFSVVATLTLGIGIGGLTAIASIIRGVLLAPLPLPESDRLVTYWLTAPDKGLGEVDLTDALFAYQRERTRVFAGLAAYTTDGFNLSGIGEPERLVGAEVTDNFFRVLGVPPLLGREFLPRETTPGNDHVAILSQGFWIRHFGADPTIVGRSIELNGSPITVVGVMPRAADFPRQTDVWMPAVIDPHRYSYWYLQTLGRLRPGHTVEDVRHEIGALTDAFAVDRPESKLDASAGQTRVVALKLTQSIVGDLRTPLFVLLASVVGVLLIACANIGTLSLARAIARAREMAVRQCLGASRRRLAAQLLTESALVAVAGSVIGVASAIWSVAGLRRWSQGQIPRLDQVHVDPLTLALVAAATIACGFLFGLAPAWLGSRVETREAVNAGSRGSAHSAAGRWNNALVITQFALSLALLIAAGLLIESFTRLTAVDPGFRADNVLLARLQTTSQRYDAPRAVLSFYDAVLERTAALPGVRATGVTSHVPFSHGDPQDEFVVEGREPAPGQPTPVTSERAVSPSYFAAIGTPIVAGRDFGPSDDSRAAPVAVVNETLARRYWPATGPIGKRLHFGTTRGSPWMTVIGVVADTKESSLADAPKFQVYQPVAQSLAHEVVLVVRTQTVAADIGPAVRAVVRALDPSIPVYDVHSMDAAVTQSLSARWLTNVTLAGFAAVALLLAAIGVYGVMSLAVAARIREFGIRLAIGARPTEVVRLVLRDGVRLAALGMAIGLVASAWLTRFLSSLLFATPPLDPIILRGSRRPPCARGDRRLLRPRLSCGARRPPLGPQGDRLTDSNRLGPSRVISSALFTRPPAEGVDSSFSFLLSLFYVARQRPSWRVSARTAMFVGRPLRSKPPQKEATMTSLYPASRWMRRPTAGSAARAISVAVAALIAAACAHPNASTESVAPSSSANKANTAGADLCAADNCDRSSIAPSPDPRVGLKAGLWDAGAAEWNMHLVSNSRPTPQFEGKTNSDLAFLGNYVIQGSYEGFQVWDISNAAHPTLKTAYICPASQSDVSVYKNLLFESAEAPTARLDCGTEAPKDTVSKDRIRGVRIWDISDIEHPKNIANVQTCRGSHTHTLLADPKDPDNIYIYISGSSVIRSPSELAGCEGGDPDKDPNSALFRIEVIKVPLAHPEQAAIVSSPRIFQGLPQVPSHGLAPQDVADVETAKAKGGYVISMGGDQMIVPDQFVKMLLDTVVARRGGTGTPTREDSANLHQNIQAIVTKMFGGGGGARVLGTSCHDITVYPEIGLAGGACQGHGLLLDISDPAHPVRIDAVADSNFSFWHSATLNNDGTKILFSDEWGGGGAPKCRSTDPRAWGADAIFTIENRKMVFQGYYKLPAPQTPEENCVAHNGSLIPVPGRDIMVQAWYQGGVSVFDWTDPKHPTEIAFFDRGPIDATRMEMGGSWSAYWYNGYILSSEIARGLDILELKPSALLSQNEIDAAKLVHFDLFNTQGQPKLAWPASFVVARAYVDQLARSNGLSADKIASVRQSLATAEQASGTARSSALTQLATQLDGDASGAKNSAKVQTLASEVRSLATASN